MDFAALMTRMTQSACRGDGAQVAACFTEDGVYDDVFYGAFKGRAAIRDMIENHFHRDAGDFVWDLHDPVSDGAAGYVRYVFSYTSKLPASKGRRALFEGVGMVRLKDGLIAHYSEVAEVGTGLSMMGFAADHIAGRLAKAARTLAARPEARGHIPD